MGCILCESGVLKQVKEGKFSPPRRYCFGKVESNSDKMADLEAVLADVSYLMAMEKSKSTPAARASKKIILPDPRYKLFDGHTMLYRCKVFAIDQLLVYSRQCGFPMGFFPPTMIIFIREIIVIIIYFSAFEA